MHAGLAFQARPHSNGRRGARLTAAAALAVLGGLFGQPAAAQLPQGQPLPAVTELVSSSSAELAGNEDSSDPSVDAAAFLIAFESRASNLVPNDTNDPTPGQIGGGKDVFVRNRGTGTTSRVSISDTQAQANSDSDEASISADGLRVAFTSSAFNLVANDTNDATDIFVRDRGAGTTTRVSVPSFGTKTNANDDSGNASISADGQWVAFTSSASNLTLGDTNGANDVFVHNIPGRFTRRVSLSSTEANGNQRSTSASISGDGRYVAFESRASNLVPNDTNDPTPGQIGGGKDVFVRDQQAGTTTRVSVRSNGAQATGRDSSSPAISADGRWVAFASGATNLVNNDVNDSDDVFLHDRVSGATRLASRSTTGEQASTGSLSPAISADGRWVAFTSRAANLVPSDTNNDFDVFRYDRVTQSTGRFSLTTSGGQTAPGGSSDSPTISADGSKIAFDSDATNMGPANGLITHDVFLRRPDPEVAA